jgi:hypothetical protein
MEGVLVVSMQIDGHNSVPPFGIRQNLLVQGIKYVYVILRSRCCLYDYHIAAFFFNQFSDWQFMVSRAIVLKLSELNFFGKDQ